jgi:hypothetical protein
MGLDGGTGTKRSKYVAQRAQNRVDFRHVRVYYAVDGKFYDVRFVDAPEV